MFFMYGLGLRSPHVSQILSAPKSVDFFEAISENFMGITETHEKFDGSFGGRPLENLLKIRRDYPVVLHGVSLSIGSTDPLNRGYLKKLSSLIEKVAPLWVSDHLCWTGVGGENLHDLLPLPYTREAVRHVSERIVQVQDLLKRRLTIENVSSYISFRHSEMTEWEFINEICTASDCEILLDINNIYVSSRNHLFDPLEFLRAIPVSRVKQFHLAGHLDKGDYCIDTHDFDVCDPVWELYREAVQKFGTIPLILERDANIPPFETLIQELNHARKFAKIAPSHHIKSATKVAALDGRRSARHKRRPGRPPVTSHFAV